MKSFYKSKTLWGVFLTMLPTVAPLIGFSMDDVHLINQAADNILQFCGAVLAVIGRVKAEQKIRAY